MKKLMKRESSEYDAFGLFLKRKGIENSYSLASLLIDKFVFSKNASCYFITCEDLREKNILPGEKHKTFGHWRDEMIKIGVLICMADKKELLEKIPNHKGNLFKPGAKIKKHIDKITMKNMPDKFREMGDRVGIIENKIDIVEHKIDEFDERFDKIISMLLKLSPPDNIVRRQIIRENFMDNERCFELLNDETKQWITDYDNVEDMKIGSRFKN